MTEKSVLRFQLTESERAEFVYWFDPPFPWPHRGGGEVMRWWHVLRTERSRVLLQHGTGAVAVLVRDGGTIIDVTLLEGADAEPLLRKYGLQPSNEDRARARRILVNGEPVESAVDRLFPRKRWLRELRGEERPGGGRRRRFLMSWGAVIEVKVGPGGIVRGHRWLSGDEAFDLIRSAEAEE